MSLWQAVFRDSGIFVFHHWRSKISSGKYQTQSDFIHDGPDWKIALPGGQRSGVSQAGERGEPRLPLREAPGFPADNNAFLSDKSHVHEPELAAAFDGIRWRRILRCRSCLVELYEVAP